MVSDHSRIIHAIFVVFLVLLCQSAVADINVSKDAWKETGLKLEFVESRINTASCYRTEADFAACAKAIQAMLDINARRLRLVSSDQSDKITNQVVVARYGTLIVVEQNEAIDEPVSSVFEVIKARHQQEQALRAAYRNKDSYVEFARLREWVISEIVESGSREAYAAAAINGYISVSDVHARIFPAEGEPNPRASDRGGFSMGPSGMRYSGIGVAIERAADSILITNVVKESPAAAIRLRPSDVILAIAGEPVSHKSVPEVVEKLRGPPGTEVSLAILSQEKTRSVRVRRADVEVKNVVAFVLDDRAKRWGHIHIRGFMMPNTCAAVERELRELKRRAVDGIVLDLRDNLGGRIDLAVCVADHFLPERFDVVEMRNLKNQRHSKKLYSRFPATTTLPLVSLVNASTGSASEVLVSALQDHGRGPVVGQRTFGKATMQTIRPWNGSKSILQYKTVARMYSPSGRSAHLIGITPDVVARPALLRQASMRQELRLEDMFPSAMPAEGVTTRLALDAKTADLRACVAEKGAAEQRWKAANKAVDDAYDYPVFVAQDALHCLASRSREATHTNKGDTSRKIF